MYVFPELARCKVKLVFQALKLYSFKTLLVLLFILTLEEELAATVKVCVPEAVGIFVLG